MPRAGGVKCTYKFASRIPECKTKVPSCPERLLRPAPSACRRVLAPAAPPLDAPRPRARRAARRSPEDLLRWRVQPPGRAASLRATGFRGSSGPCRYVPIARSTRQPSKPDSPSFPNPWTTRPSGSAPSSRSVRPAWFSKPATVRRRPGTSSHSSRTSPIIRVVPATVSWGNRPTPGIERPVAPPVAAPEQLVAAAHREQRGAVRPPPP